MFTLRPATVDFNGTWKFIPDPMQRCRRQQWWKKPSIPNSVFPCWDPEGFWDIQVPGTWKTQFPELKWYDGHATYFKQFDARPADPEEEAFLVFDGIVYASEVMLNGHRLARHQWGYSSFQVRVTDVLLEKNQLFVLVDNLLSKDRVPGEIFDWCNDGGIINGVKLIYVPATYIHNFRASTHLNADSVRIDIEVHLASRDLAAREKVQVKLPELGLETTIEATAGAPAVASFQIPRQAIRLWCPEDPKLYQLELITPRERLVDEIGLREIRTEGRRIILNGKPIRLYGCSVHSEFPGSGRTATPEAVENVVKAAKELGLNFLRCAHYPYAEIFGRAMDRAGLLWWEEIPAYWIFNVREEAMSALACGMLEETIRRDWNRASLIIWSVSNECCWRNPEDPLEHNYAYWIKAAALIRRLDPGRLISCAETQNLVSQAIPWASQARDSPAGAATHRPMHADELYQLCDILAGNLYVGEPGEEKVSYPRFVEIFRRYNKPLMLSEFGSMSLLGSDVPPDELGSEVRHSLMIKLAYEIFEKLPELTGYAPWVLADGRAPIHWRWYNQGTGCFRFGFLNEKWQPKQAFFTLKECIKHLKEYWDAVESAK